MLPDEFFLPFGGKLNPNNRWCQLASIVPREEGLPIPYGWHSVLHELSLEIAKCMVIKDIA